MTVSVNPEITPVQRERIFRRNFWYFLADNLLFTVALSIIGSTTVIPDFVRHLTDSEILIGLSGSVFTIGFTLPQLFVARYIIRYARKKWWFAGPNIPVRFVILIFAIVTVILGAGRPEGRPRVRPPRAEPRWADPAGDGLPSPTRARTRSSRGRAAPSPGGRRARSARPAPRHSSAPRARAATPRRRAA